ncbi:MAG: hypothetical protein ACYTEL_20390 [Planctomycetota bacterium]
MANEETWGVAKPGVEEFFESIGPVIREFASNHNLKIQKYYNNIDGWQLVFRHPNEGACYIEILKKDEQEVSVLADWWVDDCQRNERLHIPSDDIECSVDEEVLFGNLENLFQQVISWKKEDLISLGKSFEPLTKEAVEEDLRRYPVPKLQR